MDTSIQPHRITLPIQAVAAFLAALVLTEGSIMGAVAAVDHLAWLRALLIVGGLLCIPAFITAPFLLLTKFRAEMQEDRYYAVWLQRTAPTFQGFKPERIGSGADIATSGSEQDLERQRKGIYERQRGLFLVHSWRPSTQPGQVADIVIEMYQHGEGPLTWGTIESVEYQLGPMFFLSLL